MASFECSGEDEERQYQKYPIRRLEPSIQKFLKVINIDLGRLHQHKLNIEKVGIKIISCVSSSLICNQLMILLILW